MRALPLPLVILLLSTSLALSLRAETPTLAVQEIYPPVVSAGQTSPVKITAGRFTQDIEALVFSHPGIQATLESAPNLPHDDAPQHQYGSFQVQVGSDVPEGVYEVWAVGRYGVSNPRTIAVVHRPVALLGSDPNPNPLPQLKPGIIYVGHTIANARMAFQVETANRNPRLAIVVGSLESMALPSLVVRDSRGKTIVQKRVHTEPYLLVEEREYRNSDSEDADTDEPLIYGLSDFLFRGGNGYAFAIAVDAEPSEPWMTMPYTDVSRLAGHGLSEWPAKKGNDPCESCPIEMPAPPWSHDLTLANGNSRHVVEFAPQENRVYECEVLSDSPHVTTDFRAVLERVAKAENQESKEAISIAEDGPTLGSRGVRWIARDPLTVIPAGDVNKKVRITLIDLLHSASRRYGTQATIRVGPLAPRFQAVAHWTPDTNQPQQANLTGACLRRGGQIGLHVLVRRAGGFSGPVTLSVEGLPAGVTAEAAVVGEGQSETELVLYADEIAVSWTGPIQVMARATLGETEITQKVAAATISVSASSDRGYPESRTTSQCMLRVIEQEVAPMQIRVGDGKVIEVPQGGTLAIPVRAVRRAGGEAKCILRPQNIPTKVTLGEFELAAGATEANPECKVAADAPLGESTIWYVVETTMKQSLHPEAHLRAVAYRDRLQSRLADPSWNGDRPALEKAIADAQARVDALAKEVAPRDFPTFFSAASFRLRIVPPTQETK
ncbi:MAG: hypothetical protein MUF23_04535 [Pirellula sp.]|jgi:hypothetical protein|nr:hypothetical protein [Pirellula sp.]